MLLTWPLIGRSEEMRHIEAAISASDLSGIVICGAAGVGKSRIAREALSSAALKGCEVRWAVGTTSARSLPLGAFATWAGSGVTDNLHLVRAVIDSLTSADPGRTVVVGVDDGHLLDDLSIFVLHQIVQRGAAKVVLTVRDAAPIPAGIPDVWKGGQFDRLDLQPLSLDETTSLVSATLGGSVDPETAHRLWQLTRGNVLYLRNIVEREVRDGRLAQQHGYWRWIGEPIVPPGLVELIESQIGALPTSVSTVIDALAVGEPIDLALLIRITDHAAVEEADTRGLITLDLVEGGAEVRLAHPLYGEVRRKRAAPTRLRRLRGLISAELAASDDRGDIGIMVRRATLSLDSDLDPDPDLLVKAAQGAVGLPDLPLADRLADAAIRAGGGAEANFVRAFALSWLSRGQMADTVLADIPTSDLTDADGARLAFLRAANRLFPLADPAGAKKLIEDASYTTPPRARGCIDAFLAVYWAAMGKPEAARESSKNVAQNQLPDLVCAVTAWATADCIRRCRPHHRSRGRRRSRIRPCEPLLRRCVHAVRHCRQPCQRTRAVRPGCGSLVRRRAAAPAGSRFPGSRSANQYRRGRSSGPCLRPPQHRIFAPGTGGRDVDRLGRDQRFRLSVPAATHDCARHARFDR